MASRNFANDATFEIKVRGVLLVIFPWIHRPASGALFSGESAAPAACARSLSDK